MLNDIGTLLARVTLGASIAAHGAQKAWGTFEGPGPQGAAAFLESLGFVPGDRYAAAAARSELISGLLIGLGLGGPVGPAALIATMIVAQTTVHAKNGFFAQKNGIELGLLYATGALALASGGYGRLSLDELFGWRTLRAPGITALGLVAGVACGLVILTQRTSPQRTEPSAEAEERAVAAERDLLATTRDHIAAASEDRPVPADLIVAPDTPTGV